MRVPETAKADEVIEIRAMIDHPMESGFRLSNVGKPIAREIVQSFVCEYDGREVFRVTLHPAVSTNPYFLFHVRATRSGEMKFTWRDDRGGMATHVARLAVTE
ncbi:MAG: thiosulfate oxidation carrier complex protein SoxZ [Burkholderiales bacterium]|nr:thiosulfate oxidation carrier complex protein SoxZ [Burkholderiales bacterium]